MREISQNSRRRMTVANAEKALQSLRDDVTTMIHRFPNLLSPTDERHLQNALRAAESHLMIVQLHIRIFRDSLAKGSEKVTK